MLLSLICIASSAFAQADDAAVVASLKKAAVPLTAAFSDKTYKDLAPLEKLLKDVDVVGAGECTHGSREVFEMKGRLFRFLVERMGYTVFALESSMPACVALDRYVTKGEGDPAEALKAQGFWTWSTEEVLDLVKWMRAYNADAKHKSKLRIVGVDMQDRMGALNYLVQTLKDAKIGGQIVEDQIWFPRVRYEKGREGALNELDKIVKDALPKVEEQLGKERAAFFKQCARVFVQADELEQQAVVIDDFYEIRGEGIAALGPLRERISAIKEDAKSLPEEARYAIDQVEIATKTAMEPNYDIERLKKGVEQVRQEGPKRKGFEKDYEHVAAMLDFMIYIPKYIDALKKNWRDIYMAQNVEWTIQTYLPKQKAMLWAHNYHVGRAKEGTRETCGGELNRKIGSRYFPIGFAFGSGGFVARGPLDQETGRNPLVGFTVGPEAGGTLDKTLAKVGMPAYFVDCATPSLKSWLESAQTTRNFGSGFDATKPEMYVGPVEVGQFYRGLIFLREVTAARTLKGMQ